MIVTAEDVVRSLRGTAALLNRRSEGLKSFDMTEKGFWHSFGAIWLALPAFVVVLAFERHRLGLLGPGAAILDASWVTAVVAAGYVASFLVLPVGMIGIARRLGLGPRYVPFVIVTNWSLAVGLTFLSVPAALLLVGWATPSLAVLYALAFGAIAVHLLWFGTKAALGVSGGLAAAIVVLALALDVLIAGTVDSLAG
ncbi:MAG TPA: hypothetical protein VF601_19705 [Beijerinckiaceae bacterium]|jgi:hypothetical protein